MDKDVGKVPEGAVYTASPEAVRGSASGDSATEDFSLLNGETDQVETFSSNSEALPLEQAETDRAHDHPNPTTASMPLEQLKQILTYQLEYYFSRENMISDFFLLSQMDKEKYVPIITVANFNRVRNLTTDIKLITEVLRECSNVQVDDKGLNARPNYNKYKVILRNIPDSTPLEEVKGLFTGINCPKFISCKFAHNNSWYVTFENDADAHKACRFLREEVREFQGKFIMARIKPMNRLTSPDLVPIGGMIYVLPPSATSTDDFAHCDEQIFSFTADQEQIYFEEQQQVYPPNELQTWDPAFSNTHPRFSQRRYRRRRKDNKLSIARNNGSGGDSRTAGACSPRPQFDLVAAAFPALPQHEGSSTVNQIVKGAGASGCPITATVTTDQLSLTTVNSTSTATGHVTRSSPQWTENRFSDVVKGKGKIKRCNSGAAAKDLNETMTTTSAAGFSAVTVDGSGEENSGPVGLESPSPLTTQTSTEYKKVTFTYAEVAQRHKEKAEREKPLHQQQQQQQQRRKPKHQQQQQQQKTSSELVSELQECKKITFTYAEVAQRHKEKAEREKPLHQKQQQQQQKTSSELVSELQGNETAGKLSYAQVAQHDKEKAESKKDTISSGGDNKTWSWWDPKCSQE